MRDRGISCSWSPSLSSLGQTNHPPCCCFRGNFKVGWNAFLGQGKLGPLSFEIVDFSSYFNDANYPDLPKPCRTSCHDGFAYLGNWALWGTSRASIHISCPIGNVGGGPDVHGEVLAENFAVLNVAGLNFQDYSLHPLIKSSHKELTNIEAGSLLKDSGLGCGDLATDYPDGASRVAKAYKEVGSFLANFPAIQKLAAEYKSRNRRVCFKVDQA